MDLLEIECQKTIGNTRYTFYFPVSVGDFFVCCWTEETMETSHFDFTSQPILRYSINIYENGHNLDPTHDSRFKDMAWAKGIGSWHTYNVEKHDFTKLLHNVTRSLSDVYCY
eukprot:TRINITY_DN1409_c0_g1_i2.p1 TRINITY_DN1409_c0_g1~~TRINITY_DN1409_c0_g1_i2.p1  ORF type:complete len:112 (-),score=10.73 TRINITY_DN1409_c0_g1_i2:409-744(-)